MYPSSPAIYEDYACSPCLYMFTSWEGMWCNHEGWCMQAITTERVLDAVQNMLDTSLMSHQTTDACLRSVRDSGGPTACPPASNPPCQEDEQRIDGESSHAR